MLGASAAVAIMWIHVWMGERGLTTRRDERTDTETVSLDRIDLPLPAATTLCKLTGQALQFDWQPESTI